MCGSCVQGTIYNLCWLVQEYLINECKAPVYGMKLPTGFQLIGQVVRPAAAISLHNTTYVTLILLTYYT